MAKDGTRRGRRKGSKNRKTLDKEAARAVLREMVTANMGPLVEAQLANARGIKYLVARNKRTGKFEKLTQAEAAVKMGQESEWESIEVWEERPNVQAFADLMNRTIDKPKEHMDANVNVVGLAELVETIREGRERARRSTQPN